MKLPPAAWLPLLLLFLSQGSPALAASCCSSV